MVSCIGNGSGSGRLVVSSRGFEITTATIEREFSDGATAIVRGALAAGCDFFAGYPITPASPILMMMLRDLPARGGIGMQGEDEIASIGMCIGAAMTGARAMTATAGPGISLYSENIGLAVMGEVPLVIVDVQRLGPSTGAATTTAQGDVQFVRWGTAGGSSAAGVGHLLREAFTNGSVILLFGSILIGILATPASLAGSIPASRASPTK